MVLKGGRKEGEMGLRICTEKHKECIIFEGKGEKGVILRCPLCEALKRIEELMQEEGGSAGSPSRIGG